MGVFLLEGLKQSHQIYAYPLTRDNFDFV